MEAGVVDSKEGKEVIIKAGVAILEKAIERGEEQQDQFQNLGTVVEKLIAAEPGGTIEVDEGEAAAYSALLIAVTKAVLGA